VSWNQSRAATVGPGLTIDRSPERSEVSKVTYRS
jgi:hypothetical protein